MSQKTRHFIFIIIQANVAQLAIFLLTCFERNCVCSPTRCKKIHITLNVSPMQSRVAVQSDVCCSVIRDLLRVKSRLMIIPGFNATDIDFMLESVCVL